MSRLYFAARFTHPTTPPATTATTQTSEMVSLLLAGARSRGYSLQGEMFNSDHLAALASMSHTLLQSLSLTNNGDSTSASAPQSNASLVELHTQVIRDWTIVQVVRAINSGLLVLVPYDKDRDHSPIEDSGASAHWGLVVGFAAPAHLLHTICSSPTSESDTSPPAQDSRVHFICLHGRSQHLAVWDANKLLKSNRNLRSCNQYKQDGEQKYVIPEDLVNLRACCVVVGDARHHTAAIQAIAHVTHTAHA
eukprot:c10517_g1_i2.p1 GENE.c10517_g1_i2~~c10517_g1_i2.p1  ORF type:complete len:250 (-),score=54.89 c10517_g1_i2:130-879(-)